MKTIRGKILVYFLVFVVLFQVTAISIYVSSNELMNTYDESFQRFLRLNAISQKADDLFTRTKILIVEPEAENETAYYDAKRELQAEKEELASAFQHIEDVDLNNYHELISTFILESELTVGFHLRGDIEQYTYHLEESRMAAGYIQESALELIDVELTAYQAFYKDLQLRNEYFLLFIVFLFMTTILLAVFFALWFSNGITKPLSKLAYAAKEVSTGDLLGDPVTVKGKDELRILGDSFNHMRSSIHGLVEEIKDQSELDQLLKEMELKHLQNQINPHFLFNTLNTVSKMAYLEDAQSTSALVDSIATLLRHSLGEINKSVRLSEEVEVVREYFRIQKTRFSERVQFDVRIKEACLAIEVPKLTLQPLIENAFIHGIEEREEGGTISLVIDESEEHVFVDIHDNGEGMTEEKIASLLLFREKKADHVGHSTGIGLANVIRRLQLFYQQDHVVEIESEVGKGTKIRLILPRRLIRGE